MRRLALLASMCAVATGCAPANRPDLALLAEEACTRLTIVGGPTPGVAMLQAAAAEARRNGYSDDAFHAALVNQCPNLMESLDAASAPAP